MQPNAMSLQHENNSTAYIPGSSSWRQNATWRKVFCTPKSPQDPALRQVVALKTARIRDAKEHYQAGAAVFVRIPERSTWISWNMPPTKSGLWIETVKSAVWWQSQCCNQAYMRICESLHIHIYIYVHNIHTSPNHRLILVPISHRWCLVIPTWLNQLC
jgi:hypothetical protein